MNRDFSASYSLTDCNSNFNINVNVTADSYMNFSFSQLPKDLLVFRIMKLESTSNVWTHFETILQILLFFVLFFYIYLRNKHDMRLSYFWLLLFSFNHLLVCLSPWCTFIKLKACNQIQFFTLDFIYICDKVGSFHL